MTAKDLYKKTIKKHRATLVYALIKLVDMVI